MCVCLGLPLFACF